MELVYLSAYTFPSRRAEPYYVRSMSEAFTHYLGKDFTLLIRGVVTEELSKTNAISVNAPERMRSIWYLLWFPLYVLTTRKNIHGVVFMSNDPYLLSICIFWRSLLRFKYRVCSDWHQLFNDWRDTYVARRSDFLVTTTLRLKQHLLARCEVDEKRIIVAYGGIDLTLLEQKHTETQPSPRDILGVSPDTFLVGYVGGFRSVGLEKGLGTMIRALAELDTGVHMVFVGGTKEDIALYTALAESLGVSSQCTFIGKQKFEQVLWYENGMDALVIPYPDQHHFREYGFPMKVWEYMASGKPILYSNLEIIGEVLSGRGLPFRADSPEDLALTIAHLKKDYESISLPLREKNLKDIALYTWDNRAKAILAQLNARVT